MLAFKTKTWRKLAMLNYQGTPNYHVLFHKIACS